MHYVVISALLDFIDNKGPSIRQNSNKNSGDIWCRVLNFKYVEFFIVKLAFITVKCDSIQFNNHPHRF